jgi:hypothetical protein
MPVGLLDRASRTTYRPVHPAGSIAALRRGGLVAVLVHFSGVQVRKHAISEIFQDERLSAIAHDDPVTGADLDFVHAMLRRNFQQMTGSKMLFEILKGLSKQREGLF